MVCEQRWCWKQVSIKLSPFVRRQVHLHALVDRPTATLASTCHGHMQEKRLGTTMSDAESG